MAKQTGTLQREFAALFLLGVAVAVPLVMVVWGPTETFGEAAAAVRDAGAQGGVIPAGGARWPVDLSAEDAEYLMDHLFDCLEALGAGRSLPDPEGAPTACLRDTDVPVLVRVYAPGRPRTSAVGRGRHLLDSLRAAARQIIKRWQGAMDPAQLRVRLDVLQEARAFPVEKRRAFAKRVFGEPVGVGLTSGGELVLFMPADIAGYRAGTHLDMMRGACRDAGLEPEAWTRPSTTMWRLTALGFVNEAPGGRHALESPRGLTPMRELTVSRLLRACRLAGGYMLHVWQEEGGFVSYWDPASGLLTGCESLKDQAAATAALGVLYDLRPEQEVLDRCYEAMSYLMHYTDTDPHIPTMALSRRGEVCRVVLELEASAQVLEALCRYRHASGRIEPALWIEALGEFLLYMQRDDGFFCLSYDPDDRFRSMPRGGEERLAVHAKAAYALCLAYEELGVPRFLTAAEKALDRLMATGESRDAEGGAGSYTAQEARWLTSAALELSALLPTQRYGEWVGRMAAQRRQAQLTAEAAPSPDLVGGTFTVFPPKAGPTADDLHVFVSACRMNPDGDDRNLAAARRAALYVMRLQYLPENSYYLPDPAASTGGFREQPGSNIIRLQTMESALQGLVRLARLELQRLDDND